jgi:hypothetical protein
MKLSDMATELSIIGQTKPCTDRESVQGSNCNNYLTNCNCLNFISDCEKRQRLIDHVPLTRAVNESCEMQAGGVYE